MKREDVEALYQEAREGGGSIGHVDSTHLVELCRAWLALDGAAEVALQWCDFNRGLHIEDKRMTPFEWEVRLTGTTVRIVPTPNTTEVADHGD